MANYVKFQRGSQEAYNRLKARGELDSNTLYFIYTTAGSEVGALYMGDKVIASGNVEIGATVLSDLADINLTTGLSDKAFLTYDSASQKWVPVDLADAIEAADISISAESKVDSTELLDGEEFEEACARVNSDPSTGDIVFVNDIAYIYNGEEWKAISASNADVESQIVALETQVGNLSELLGTPEQESSEASGLFKTLQDNYYTKDGLQAVVAEEVGKINRLQYKIVDDFSEMNENNIIYLIGIEDADGNNIYEEYMFIPGEDDQDGHIEKLGSLDVDLSNYVEKEVGSRLIKAEEIAKLEKISINDDGLIVPASNIQGLETVVANAIESNETIQALQTAVGSLEDKFDDYALVSQLNEVASDLAELIARVGEDETAMMGEISAINDRLTWKEMEQNI